MNGLFDLLKQYQKKNFADASPDMSPEPATYDAPDDAHSFQITLKRKRRSAMLKRMLEDAGYNDLSKMIAIKEQ